jgi:hypothetical protein
MEQEQTEEIYLEHQVATSPEEFCRILRDLNNKKLNVHRVDFQPGHGHPENKDGLIYRKETWFIFHFNRPLPQMSQPQIMQVPGMAGFKPNRGVRRRN